MTWTIDRTGWDSGLWDDEPDAAEWTTAPGYRAHARRAMGLGHWCAYVEVPRGHPWWRTEHTALKPPLAGDDCPHGGLSYDGPTDEPGTWWLGFDCVHPRDYAPGMARVEKLLRALPGVTSATMVAVDPGTSASELPPQPPPRTYRTLEYVRAEAEKLALGIAKAATPHQA
jgi:hypothetical protein